MDCKKCGFERNEGAKFCPSCGLDFEKDVKRANRMESIKHGIKVMLIILFIISPLIGGGFYFVLVTGPMFEEIHSDIEPIECMPSDTTQEEFLTRLMLSFNNTEDEEIRYIILRYRDLVLAEENWDYAVCWDYQTDFMEEITTHNNCILCLILLIPGSIVFIIIMIHLTIETIRI